MFLKLDTLEKFLEWLDVSLLKDWTELQAEDQDKQDAAPKDK